MTPDNNYDRKPSSVEHFLFQFAETAAGAMSAGVAASPTVLYTSGGVPYAFQNGLTMFQPVPSAGAASALPEGYTLATLPQMVSWLTKCINFLT
jgi:hypothetical protein